MKTILHFVFAPLIALAGASGCDDHDHDHDRGAAAPTTGAADAEHGHDHDHSHGKEIREPLGLETAGPYEVAPVQLGNVNPGGDVAFDVEILGQPRPVAVRFWIGDAGAAGAPKSPAESEKDNVYHVDLSVPPTVSPRTRLWVEIESAEAGPGQPLVSSFALK